MSRTQVIRCHCCGERGVIARSEFFADGRGEMVVRCSNPECGHVWVMVSEYSHTRKPSRLPSREGVHQCGN
ncbi:TPA: ogr/Delta-like zinc finger family protein [Salmonella enterica subsp. diarizonae serovar 60-67:z35:-]